MISLKNKKCLITGGTRGIGKEITILLEKEGCKVLAVGRKDGDLSTYEGTMKLINLTNSRFESIDILINCAGIYFKKPIELTHLGQYEEIFNVNVKAPWMLCREYIPGMKGNNWGRIINIGSISSYHGHSDQTLYNASKHAILGISRCLVKELNDYNIRVMCVSPSGVQTDMGEACKGEDQDIKTFLEPKEIAEHVVFNLKFDGQLVNTEIRLNRLYIRPKEKVL